MGEWDSGTAYASISPSCWSAVDKVYALYKVTSGADCVRSRFTGGTYVRLATNSGDV